MSEYRGLRALELAEQLAVECRLEAARFPRTDADLADQLRRAATGVALTIAEGGTRASLKDQRRFLDTSRASLREVEFILRIAHRSGLIPAERYRHLQALRDETARTVFGLLRSINARLDNGEERRKLG